MEIDLVLKRKRTGDRTIVAFEIPTQFAPLFLDLFRRGQKSNDHYRLRITLPHRPRTTGKHSQNARINGFIQQIAMTTGMPFQGLKEWLKAEAIGEGYPFVILPTGEVLGKSEADISVEEAAILINVIERIAAEWGINLVEE